MALPFVGQTPVQFIPRGGVTPSRFWWYNVGPWKFGGNYYAFAVNVTCIDSYDPVPVEAQVTCAIPNMYRSTDNGATWEIQDKQFDTDRPYWNTHTWPNVYFRDHVPAPDYANNRIWLVSKIRVSRSWNDYSYYLQIGYFDIATNEWVQDDCIDLGPECAFNDRLEYDANSFFWDIPTIPVVRSDGSVVIFFCGDRNASGWTTLYYVVYNPATRGWGTPVLVKDDATAHTYPIQATVTSDDRIHLFCAQSQTTGRGNQKTSTVCHVAVNANGAMGTFQVIDSDGVGLYPIPAFGRLAEGSDTAQDGIAFTYRSLEKEEDSEFIWKHKLVYADDALTPTFASDDIPFPYTVTEECSYRWATNYYHVYGGADFTAWRDGESIYVIAGTYLDSGSPDFDPVFATIWALKRDSEGSWSQAKIYETDPDVDWNWLYGGPSVQIYSGGSMGMLFWALNSNSDNNYSNEYTAPGAYGISERLYFILSPVTVSGWAYFGAGMGATNTGNYSFLV